ncbi:uncharacterized protein NDAI_0K02490 [Naumovozyma dairenensis CBS 421]|uniref:Uncharacterized protein n=1 Tax=Naumovozyma dairenensis (strain ATCC 10597 / BCRC 20456 / CBS 421 / NBRC 0211 / NRRL Y-12639) TaxID=1071378 RepID=G0WI29_NAUDC|nr:hypothetical protein NDAI_0K02490 [Naumovozyma dairenensis CBS 421]CCD27440.1 hypothetical protein NDAI_0K02490 [Naumovozyma dairenensis CBS 421]
MTFCKPIIYSSPHGLPLIEYHEKFKQPSKEKKKAYGTDSLRKKIFNFFTKNIPSEEREKTVTKKALLENPGGKDFILDDPFIFILSQGKKISSLYRNTFTKESCKRYEAPLLCDSNYEKKLDQYLDQYKKPILLIFGLNFNSKAIFLPTSLDKMSEDNFKMTNQSGTNISDMINAAITYSELVQFQGSERDYRFEIIRSLGVQSNQFEFLPPSEYSNFPLPIIFLQCHLRHAIIYRDFLIVCRNKVMREHREPSFENILKIFNDPPYEITMELSPNEGIEPKFYEWERERDITWAERHCYQQYFLLRAKLMSYDRVCFPDRIEPREEGLEEIQKEDDSFYVQKKGGEHPIMDVYGKYVPNNLENQATMNYHKKGYKL